MNWKERLKVVVVGVLCVGFIIAWFYIQHVKYPHLDFVELLIVSLFR